MWCVEQLSVFLWAVLSELTFFIILATVIIVNSILSYKHRKSNPVGKVPQLCYMLGWTSWTSEYAPTLLPSLCHHWKQVFCKNFLHYSPLLSLLTLLSPCSKSPLAPPSARCRHFRPRPRPEVPYLVGIRNFNCKLLRFCFIKFFWKYCTRAPPPLYYIIPPYWMSLKSTQLSILLWISLEVVRLLGSCFILILRLDLTHKGSPVEVRGWGKWVARHGWW